MDVHPALLSFLRERASEIIVTPVCYDFRLELGDLYGIPGRVDFENPLQPGIAFALGVLPRAAYPLIRSMRPRIEGTQYQLVLGEEVLDLNWMVPCPVIPDDLRLTRTLFEPVFGVALEVAWDLYRQFEHPTIH